jgi:hypothetical protein
MNISKALSFFFLFAGSLYSSRAQDINSVPKSQDWITVQRKSIIGNFSAYRKIDTLYESVISSINNQELDKYPSIEYDSLVAFIVKNKPICRIQSPSLKPLIIKSSTFQLFGLLWLKNEGDLNNDGTDEIGLVVDWADWSNLNSYKVLSYKDNIWIEILSFEILETDINELKENNDSKGFLFRDTKGNLIERTYYQGERIEKKIKIKE